MSRELNLPCVKCGGYNFGLSTMSGAPGVGSFLLRCKNEDCRAVNTTILLKGSMRDGRYDVEVSGTTMVLKGVFDIKQTGEVTT